MIKMGSKIRGWRAIGRQAKPKRMVPVQEHAPAMRANQASTDRSYKPYTGAMYAPSILEEPMSRDVKPSTDNVRDPGRERRQKAPAKETARDHKNFL